MRPSPPACSRSCRLTLVVFCLVIAVGCSKSPFQRIPDNELDPAQKAKAERIARRLFSSWKMGIYDAPGEDFSVEMRRVFTPRAQRQAYQSIRTLFGDLESLRFVEALRPRSGTNLVIYRFRGKFSASSYHPEVRVVFDGEGKVSGFWCKPWRRRLL